MWIRRAFQRALVALAVVTLLAMAMEMVRLPERAVLGMSERDTEIRLVVQGGPAFRAGLRDGDRLVEIAGTRTTGMADPSAFLRARGLEPTPLLVLRKGETFRAELRPTKLSGTDLAVDAARAISAAITLLIGTWVLRQRFSEISVVFFGICFALSVLSFRPFVPATPGAALIARGAVSAFSATIPGVLLHFFLLFPFERRAIHENRWILLFVYLPGAVLGPLSALPILLQTPLGSRGTEIEMLVETGTGAYWILALVFAIFLFVRSFRSSPLPVVRAKLRVSLLGSLLGFLPLLVVLLVRLARPDIHMPGDRLATVTLVFLPATFGYAILRHGIVDTELLAQRGFLYSALTSAFLLVYFLAFFGLRAALSGTTGLEGRVGTTLALGFVLLLMSPLRSYLQEKVDRWIYPDRFYIRRPLRESAQRLQEARGLDEVGSTVLRSVSGLLRVEQSVLLLARRDELVTHTAEGIDPETARITLSRHVADAIFRQNGPISRAELEDDLPYGYLPTSDLAGLRQVNARMFLPLTSARGRLGAVVLGPREYGERYSGPDLDLLEGVQAQAALALENALLEVEHQGHVHLAEELEIARSIQQELLPREIPQLPKLDLAAVNKPCFAVGGDYYDCATLPDGSLALAVADVTGHGVPAALLMSNIQATFRAEVHANRDPGEILRTLNDRLCAIDRPERFATFFTARWEPGQSELLYANGGHGPPVLVRRSGSIERLRDGGPVLGIVPGAQYDVGTVRLEPGDLLLVYTDGVVEQGGPEGNFQETELLAFLESHRHLSPRDLIGQIQERIDPSLDDSFADDTTLFVLKRV
ncbi:MAG: SpoIIE family protein phosphatase [Candidatus Eisenbacteria bacterium]|uniref:SpoIIE family protein phosphatase n=1 Tax=Eiseniibacteriota bacterium TaxID=2212470 RepID=A0A956SDS9_UNCEI|nr:SpoIIE family protein phosphatase [Candidatus Eisenbacteria bacterium]